MPPGAHALLSPSAYSRWSHCTAAPHYEQQFEESSSEYAAEGTLAHEICELKVLKHIGKINQRQYSTRLAKIKKHELFQPEMLKTSDVYLDVIRELEMEHAGYTIAMPEVRLDISAYIPECHGTSDCVIVSPTALTVVDYKHGKGVPVSAEGNGQMRIYALGALAYFKPIFGDGIKTVAMAIVQPRLSESPSIETISTEELLAWGEELKPIAREAFYGPGKFNPSEKACRFCRGKAVCSARAKVNLAMEEFKQFDHDKLTNEQIGDLLSRGKDLAAWYKDLEEYALKAGLAGQQIPGYKVVAGRSNRRFRDEEEAMTALCNIVSDPDTLYTVKPKSLSELEKMIDKDAFEAAVGSLIVKPYGKPVLVPESDKREPYSSAEADFGGVAG